MNNNYYSKHMILLYNLRKSKTLALVQPADGGVLSSQIRSSRRSIGNKIWHLGEGVGKQTNTKKTYKY